MSSGEQFFESFDLRREKLNEQIADQVQNVISSGQLRPGDRLPSERDLARLLSVNRATVREAQQILQQRGLVEMRPGSGTYVTEISPEVVGDAIVRYFASHQCSHRELQEVREVIEPEIAALAAVNANAGDLETLARHLKRLERAWESGESSVMAAADADYHLALAGATHNDLFVAIISGLSLILERDIATQYDQERAAGSFPLHQEVYEAISAGSPELAREKMHTHMDLVPPADGPGTDAEQ